MELDSAVYLYVSHIVNLKARTIDTISDNFMNIV